MPTIERILCPCDFSETSEHATEMAIALAKWYKARIIALHVYEPVFMPVPGLPAPADRTSPDELKRVRDQTVAAFRAATENGIGVDVVVDIGRPAVQILQRSSALSADLIVMGTHGAGGFEHLVLGSVAEKVLRKAVCPVVTVPPRAHATSQLPFRRLLCALDFSDPSLSALDLACSLAQESGSSLVLLHVLEWPWEEPPAPSFVELPPEQGAALAEYRRYLEKGARDRLAGLVPAAVRDRCEVVTLVRHGKSHVGILDTARHEDVDLIVMGVHGRKTLDLMLLGSTTNQVVRRATCPVLTLRK